jgi:hypothetical protein
MIFYGQKYSVYGEKTRIKVYPVLVDVICPQELRGTIREIYHGIYSVDILPEGNDSPSRRFRTRQLIFTQITFNVDSLKL